MKEKICTRCKEKLDILMFYSNKSRKDGYASRCKSCSKKDCLEHRHRHPQRLYEKELDAKTKIKVQVFSEYCSGDVVCAGCGHADIRALTIDHINGGGKEHRRQIKRNGGTDFYRWLRDNDYPKGFQILCMNCQWVKRYENNEHNRCTQ